MDNGRKKTNYEYDEDGSCFDIISQSLSVKRHRFVEELDLSNPKLREKCKQKLKQKIKEVLKFGDFDFDKRMFVLTYAKIVAAEQGLDVDLVTRETDPRILATAISYQNDDGVQQEAIAFNTDGDGADGYFNCTIANRSELAKWLGSIGRTIYHELEHIRQHARTARFEKYVYDNRDQPERKYDPSIEWLCEDNFLKDNTKEGKRHYRFHHDSFAAEKEANAIGFMGAKDTIKTFLPRASKAEINIIDPFDIELTRLLKELKERPHVLDQIIEKLASVSPNLKLIDLDVWGVQGLVKLAEALGGDLDALNNYDSASVLKGDFARETYEFDSRLEDVFYKYPTLRLVYNEYGMPKTFTQLYEDYQNFLSSERAANRVFGGTEKVKKVYSALFSATPKMNVKYCLAMLTQNGGADDRAIGNAARFSCILENEDWDNCLDEVQEFASSSKNTQAYLKNRGHLCDFISEIELAAKNGDNSYEGAKFGAEAKRKRGISADFIKYMQQKLKNQAESEEISAK